MPTRTSTSRWPRSSPRRRGSPSAADVFVENGAFDVRQARRYLSACRDAGLVLRLHGDQFTEQGAVSLAIELGVRSVDHLEATGPDGVRALAASDVSAVLLPASALFLDRPMPPGTGARRRRRCRCTGNRLQPRQRLLREPAARVLAGGDPAEALSGGGAHRLHRQRRSCSRARRPQGTPGSRLRRGPRPSRRTRLALPRLPPRARPRFDGHRRRVGPRSYPSRQCRPASNDAAARRTGATNTSTSTSTRRAGRSRSTSRSPSTAGRRRTRRRRPRGTSKAKPKSGRALREPPEPSWSRSARRAVPWQIGIFVLVVFLLRSGPLISRVMIGVLYGLLFIPMMYLTDRLMRNRWLKQQGALPQKDKRPRGQ